MSTTDPPPQLEVVFQGTRSACLEFGLVLDAKALPYELIEHDRASALLVSPELLTLAREELTRYAQERGVRREELPPMAHFPAAPAGAVIYTAVLLLIAYCAGINLFGADWFSAGALQQNAHGGHDWWRALTALTLHVDQLHLLGNLLFGVAVGVIVGSIFGPGVAWASILAAGALGNYLELLIAPPDHRAVGASTAVFAALGLLSGYGWRRRLSLGERWLYRSAPIIAGTCLLTLLGVGSEHVDVVGHLFGFLMGVALGWLYARAGLPRNRGMTIQVLAAATAIAALAVSWLVALRLTPI